MEQPLENNAYIKVFKHVELRVDQNEKNATLIDICFGNENDFFRFHKLKAGTTLEMRISMALPGVDEIDQITINNNCSTQYFTHVELRIEKRNDVTTIVDLSFDKINDFVCFRKFCAAPDIKMKISLPIPIDDTDGNSIDGSQSASSDVAARKRNHSDVDSDDSETLSNGNRSQHDPSTVEMESLQQSGAEMMEIDSGLQSQSDGDHFEPKEKKEIKFEFITGQRIGSKLLYAIDEKQLYRTETQHNEYIWFRCRVPKCVARVKFNERTNKCFKSSRTVPHNHGTQENEFRSLKLLNKVKMACANENGKVFEIYQKCLTVDEIVSLNYDKLQRTLHRIKNEAAKKRKDTSK